MEPKDEIREFLTSRRARITPQQAGLPVFGDNRRVLGLRREEAAMLAGVSVDYYTKMERGNLRGVSEGVLDMARSIRTGSRPLASGALGNRPGRYCQFLDQAGLPPLRNPRLGVVHD